MGLSWPTPPPFLIIVDRYRWSFEIALEFLNFRVRLRRSVCLRRLRRRLPCGEFSPRAVSFHLLFSSKFGQNKIFSYLCRRPAFALAIPPFVRQARFLIVGRVVLKRHSVTYSERFPVQATQSKDSLVQYHYFLVIWTRNVTFWSLLVLWRESTHFLNSSFTWLCPFLNRTKVATFGRYLQQHLFDYAVCLLVGAASRLSPI